LLLFVHKKKILFSYPSQSSDMLGFVVRRVLQMVPMLVAIALLIFLLFSVIPGSFATGQQDEGLGLDMAVVQRMRV